MHLPYLRSRKQKTEKQIVAFRGVNYGEAVRDGDLSESQNLTAERFPCMSPRAGRERGEQYQNATAVWYKDGLLVVDGSDLIYNGEVVGAVSPGKKQFANINTKVVIMPDKVVFDTKTKELRGLGAEYTTVAGTAVFASGDTESRLTTHIGSYVEGIAGSGNVGGNDVLGEKSPIFMIDNAPFTTLYESGAVNADTGSLDFGGVLTGDSLQAQNVAVGNAFIAAALGADGVKRFGRIREKTAFPVAGYQTGEATNAWKRYATTKSAVTTTNLKHGSGYDTAVSTGFSHSLVKAIGHYRAMPKFYLKSSSGTLTLVFGNGVEIGEDGYFEITNGKTVSYTFSGMYPDNLTNVDIGTFYKEGLPYATMYIGLMDGGHITSYIKMNVKTLDDEDPFSPGDPVKIDSMYVRREGTSFDDEGTVTGYTYYVGISSYSPGLDYAYTPTINTVSGQAATKGDYEGFSYGVAADTYPQDGYQDDYWYEYLGTVTNPCFYGFDYDLIEARDAEGVSGFEAVNFRAGDTVEITGCTSLEGNNIAATIRSITEETVDGVTQHSLVFDGNLFTAGTEESAVTITRKVPNLSVVCESQNRVFGAEGNTVYVSALGDPTNFYTYDGLDTDSYAVAVASEGAFTGCCGFGNSVLFWKEDKLHKILGAYPSQYTMYEYNVPGVKLGSEQSLCNINEVVYYHGREGVYRYNGGSPELISENFGLRRYEEAAAGAIEGRYYLSMKDRQKGEWGLWVYDTLKNIWLQEDDTHAMGFSANEGKLYCIGGSKLMCLNPDDSEEVFEWSATTARMDEMFHNRKCYSKLLLRAELLEDSAWLQVDVSCDGEPFKRVYTSRDKAAKTLAIPIMPKRCDSFRIRLSGEGNFIIRSLVREFDIGSEY